MKKGIIALLFFLYANCLQAKLGENDISIAWFSELNPEHSFWKQNYDFAKAVADDLGIQLVPYYLNSDQVLYKRLLGNLSSDVDRDSKVDGIVFLNIKHQNSALLDIIELGDIPAISNVLSMDYDLVGHPRQNYQRWIGEIVDDEYSNGYQLAKRLFQEARDLNLYADDETIHLVAINGNPVDSAGVFREQGMLAAVKEANDVTLKQSFNAINWSAKEAELFTTTALRRYPEASVVWAANDDAVLGVLDGAQQVGRKSGKDILTGGIDGTLTVVDKVNSGEVVCTIGGLTMHSGWAIVLLYDFLTGNDFANDTGVVIKNQNLLIDKDNVDDYLATVGKGDWTAIDFSRFSKSLSPHLKKYDFSPEILIHPH